MANMLRDRTKKLLKKLADRAAVTPMGKVVVIHTPKPPWRARTALEGVSVLRCFGASVLRCFGESVRGREEKIGRRHA